MNSLSLTFVKFLFIGFFLFSATAVSAFVSKTPRSKNDTSEQLALECRIVVKNKTLKGRYKIEVLYYNTVTSSFTVKNNAAVKLHLKKNSPYVLKISKKGFVSRYVCLNTNTYEARSNHEAYAFYLETDFIEVADARRLDNELLEMPAALVAFDKNIGNFGFNKDYTTFVNQRINTGLND